MNHDEEIASGLITAGIGARYHRRSLAEFGEIGGTLAVWVRDKQHLSDVYAGNGWSFYGGIDSHDLLYVTARACHLTGIGVKVTTLNRLIEAILDDTVRELNAAPAFFLSGFFNRDFPVCPLTPFQRMKVEDFLMHRVDENRAVFLQSSDQLENCTPWWSSSLLQRVAQVNREAFVA